MNKEQLAIWWLSQWDCEVIAPDEHCPPNILPMYLEDEFNSRYGRPGRGHLWVSNEMGDIQEIPWPEPETPLSNFCGLWCGGIVFLRKDIHYLKTLPGLITDLELNRLFIGANDDNQT